MPTQTTYDLSNCCHCGIQTICCGENKVPSTLYASVTFNWGPAVYSSITVTLTYNSGTDKWEGTGTCNGASFGFKLYCSDLYDPGSPQWLFDLISGSTNYAVPFLNQPGGFIITSCVPFEGFCQISSPGITATDFPFCGYSNGEFLNFFNATVTA